MAEAEAPIPDTDPLALPPDLQAKAREELGETPQVRAAAIPALRARLDSAPEHERPHRLDDQYLLAFLRPQHYDVEIAYTKIMAYAKYKREHKELFGALKAEDFRHFLREHLLLPLATADQEGRTVLYVCPVKMLAVQDPELVMKFQVYFFEASGLLFNPYVQVHGLLVVDDLGGLTPAKMYQLFNGPCKHVPRNAFRFIRDAMPFRMKGILMLNHPLLMDAVFAVIRPFLSPLLVSRIRLLGRGAKGLAALHGIINPEFLPPDLGGSWSHSSDDWVDRMVKLEAEGKTYAVL